METQTITSSDELDARVLDVADAIGEFIEYWGFRAIHGRVWALLALHRHPQTQTEVAAQLGVSKSFVSAAVSELAAYGLVEVDESARAARVRANIDVWPAVTEILRQRELRLIESARDALEAALAAAGPMDDGSPYDLERLEFLRRFAVFARAVVRTLIRSRIGDLVGGGTALAGRLRSMFSGR